jgi:SAM-dependent methyltransferase
MSIRKYLPLLCCPDCLGELSVYDCDHLTCVNCRRSFLVIDNIPVLLPKNLKKEQLRAIDTWGKEYRDLLKKKDFTYWDKYCEKDIALIEKNAGFQKETSIFLELGCGKARNCVALLINGYKNVIGMDISIDAVRLASAICKQHNLSNYFFVVGDIYAPPIKKAIDLIFAGGSIEHFRDTRGGLEKIYEIMKSGGEFIATVPYVSVATLLQGFLTGNIPRLPILSKCYELFHSQIMRNKNLMYGFEYSFTWRELQKILNSVGFIKYSYDLYDVEYDLKFIPHCLKNFFKKIIQLKLFWPMIYIMATKNEKKK